MTVQRTQSVGLLLPVRGSQVERERGEEDGRWAMRNRHEDKDERGVARVRLDGKSQGAHG